MGRKSTDSIGYSIELLLIFLLHHYIRIRFLWKVGTTPTQSTFELM